MDSIERTGFLAHASLPVFKRKIASAKLLIENTLAKDGAYVAVSWGKDSVVLLHLCQQIQPDILAFFYTGYWMDAYDNFTEVCNQYTERFPTNLIVWEQKKEDVLSSQTLRMVGDKFAKQLCVNTVFLGLRKEESKRRRLSLVNRGISYTYKNGITRVCPLADWQFIDIWAYTTLFNLPYLSSYDLSSKVSHQSRTTPHVVPNASGGRSKPQIELYSVEFKKLMKEFYD